MGKTTWRKLISECAGGDEIIACTLSEDELDVEFHDGFGSVEGKPFTAWSMGWVYFPAYDDGAEWVGRVPRNPCGVATDHSPF